jgi:hypothetical protein
VITVGVVTGPTIVVSPSSLDLGTTATGTAGTVKTYTVSGSNLTAGLVITAPTGVEVSSDGGTSYHTTVTLTPSSGTVASTTINVRITSAAAVGSISGKITDTSTGATEQDVTVTGTVNVAAVPTIVVTPTTLDLGTTTVGAAGTTQTYTVSGSNLTAGIVITAPAGVEVSSDGGASYHTTVTLTPASGTVASTTINTRISAAAAQGAISGKITDTSTGATEQDVTVTGTVNAAAVPTIVVTPTTLDLGTTTVGIAGTAQTYTVSGSNLTAGIVITAPAGVEVSSDGGASYHTTVTLTPASGTVASTTISTRISAAAAQGAISGKVTDTSTGATEQDVTVTGTVNAAAVPTIVVTPTTLDLGTTTVGAAGTAQTYTVSGSNLTAGIVITAPPGVEVSSDGGASYHTTVTLTPASGTVASTTISTRISAAAAQGAISGKVTDTSTGATEQDVTVTGTVNAAVPTITVSPTSLDLGATIVGTPGAVQTYTVSGANLTAGLVITAPAGVEVSGDGGLTYQTTVTLTPKSGAVASTPINVRISATAPQGALSGKITDTSTGAVEQDVAVTGTVNAVATPTIIVSPTSLDLGTATAGTAGTAQTYTVSGSNLTAGIVITAPTGVEISSDGGASYHTTLTLTPSSGTVASTTINAHISATAAGGAISGKITDTSTGAAEQDVTVTGTVAVAGPAITVTPSALALGATTAGTAGTAQTYTISGTGLTTAVTVTAPTGVEVSSDGGVTYHSTLTLTPTSGNLATTTINARISAAATQGAISDKITNVSTGATEQDVTVTGTVNAAAAPTITVSPTTLDLGTTTVGTAGTAQTYTVSGSNLTDGIVITAPAGVEVSSDGGASYHNTVTLPPTAGTVANTTINARISGAAAQGAISDKITDTSTGATEQDVTVTGTVNATTTPTIIVTPTTLNLGTTSAGTAGTAQTFTVSGSNLTTGLVVTAPTGVEVSSDNGATYHTTLTLTPNSGTVPSTTINARIASTATAGAISGAIKGTSTGATEQDVTVSGTVNATATATTTTVSTTNATPAYGTPVTLTATVAPASGTTVPTAGSVTFFINGTTSLGTGTSTGSDANHDALFTYVTTARQLQVAGGAAQPVTATYTAGTGFTGSTSTNSVTETVSPATLTVTGVTANDKVYDATKTAVLNTTGAALSGVLTGDTVTLGAASATGTLATQNVGSNIAVTVSGLTIGGAQAGNYTLTQPTTTANITAAPLTITAVTNTKVFDGTTSAAAIPTVAGLKGSDTVTGLAEAYADASVGTGKTLNVVPGFTVNDGNNGNNYTVTTVPNTTGVITSQLVVGDQTLSYHQNTFSVNLPTGATASFTIAGSMAFFLQRDLGLSLPASGLNQSFATITAKWLQGNINSFGNTWYFIKPNGQLFAWDGTTAASGSTLVGTLDPVYYVYPDLLYNASKQTYDYVLQQRLGLTFAGTFYQNYGGRNEKWLKGSANQYGNPWYFIDTTGALYAWDGTTNQATGTLLANLDTLYWAQPNRLFDAQPNEVTAAITNNVFQVTTPTNWAGKVVVELNTTTPSVSHQIFTLTFANQPPVLTITPSGNLTTKQGTPVSVTISATDPDADTPNVTAMGGDLGFVLKQSLGLRLQGSLFLNYGGQHEEWLQSNANDWYFIKPDGTLWKWDGTANQASGTQVAALDPVYYYHPDLLYNPPGGDEAFALDQRLNLTNTGNLSLNYGGQNEKWLLGNDGWYFIKPDGTLWKWDGTVNQATGTLMASLDPDYYTNIQRLYDAKPNQVAVNISGNTLTLTPAAGFIGQFWVLVRANDPSQSVFNRFELTVTS